MYNVVLITIDTLRADHLSCYGYKYRTSKHLDAFAKNAVIFSNAFSCINATDPSFTSLFTGKEPHNHGINNHGRKVTREEIHYFQSRQIKWLTTVLKKRNYTTIGIDWLGRWHKKDYDEYPFGILNFYGSFQKKNKAFRNCKAMTGEAVKLIRRLKEKPFFLFMHFWDVHKPYNYRSRLTLRKFPHNQKYVSEYDAAIYNVDKQLERIFAMLAKYNVIEKTIVIITADHGESLGEHGIHDHHGLYDCSLKIPLLMYVPTLSHKTIHSFVQTTDVMPTLLELLDIDFTEEEFDGASLLALINGEKHQLRDRLFFKENFYEKKFGIRTSKYKFIIAKNEKDATCSACKRIHGDSLTELYDLENDPEEINNIYSENLDVVENLKQEIIGHFGEDYIKEESANGGKSIVSEDEEQRLIEERLKALGYF